jgi:hypothetical protein
MMNPDTLAKDAVRKDLSSKKAGQPKDRVEAKGNLASRKGAWWGEHSQYDWMDHFSPPDLPYW